MKKVFLVCLALFMAILVLNCSKEETENNTSLNSFKLTPTEIKVFLRETTTLTISSGNGSYRINQSPESKEIVEISLANENQNVLVKALKSGTTTASITDILSKTEIPISIQAIIPPSYYTLSEDKKTLVKWNDTQEESIDLSSDPILKEITSVGEGAFKGNQTLKTITLPEKITFLGKESFSGVSKLESITLPNSITSVGEGVFAGCTALKEITLPKNDTFTTIPKRTFEDCKSLSTIQLPESIQEIGILAFADAGLTTISLPENLLEIKQQAFAGNSALTEITIPKNVTLISLAAFQETGLKTVKVEGTLPPTLNFGIDTQTQQPIEPFPSATLENIFVPESVTQIYRDKDGWHNYASIINKNKEFKHLVINPTAVTLFVDEVKQLDIVSGNDDYDLEREESTKEIAFIGITNNQKTLGIRGKKEGAFKATIIDKITREKVEISITVLNPFTLSPNQLTLSVGQTKEVIIDGNGDYEIPSNAHATLSLSGDKKKLIVKGIKEGDTKVVIKDKKANLSATLSIKVNAENVAPPPTDTVKEFSLSTSQLTLKIEEQKILTLQGNEDYEIGSSPIAQLTLSADKKTLTVKALKAGEATIKIKDKKANKELPLHITVLKAFSLSPSEVSVTTGGITIVNIEGNGDYEIPTNAHVTLTLSGDKKKLTVKGVLVGNTQVVIKDKKANQLASLDIKVTAPAPIIKEFSLSESQLSLKVNEEKTLTLQGNEDYEIGASQIAQLTLGGDKKTLTVKATKVGEETIKIKDKKTNKELPLHITVLKAFTLSPSEVSVTTGGITIVTIEGNGDYEIPTNAHVTLTLSGDKKKLTVKGVLVGNTQVVIKDKKANQLASLDIKVTAPAPIIKEFSLSESQLSLKVNEEKTLTLQGNEDYEIGASQIAQLTLGGDKKTLTVKATKVGEETIKIKDKKTNKELPLHITVLKAFTLSPSEVSVTTGGITIVTIEGNGDYEIPTNAHVTLSLSSDKKKLTVVGLQAGTARINIKDKALDETRSFVVTVLRPFSIDPNSIDIKVGETKSIAIEGSGRYQIGSSPLIDIINKTEHLITFKGKSVGNGSISIKDELANKNLNLTIKVTKALVPFSISPSTIRVKVGETKTVSITGNGKYSLSKNNSSYAELTLNEQAGTLTVKGIAKGEEKLYIRDLNSVTEENNGKKGGKDHDSEDNEDAKNYESRELTITVIPATVEKQYNLSWDKYSIDKWLDTDAQEVDMTQIDELKSIGMVGEAAFKGLTNLKKVILPNTIEVIDREAFANCTALTSIKLGGNKLDEIGNYAFSGCTKLTRIDIPKNVSRIRGGAFDDCNALQTIILRHTEVAPFHNELGYLNATIYVPDNLVEEYRKDMNWEPYKDKIKPISELTGRKIRK
nr:leucine-rich repeat domain-containing protein [uncultured Capnocytophaga sp.]